MPIPSTKATSFPTVRLLKGLARQSLSDSNRLDRTGTELVGKQEPSLHKTSQPDEEERIVKEVADTYKDI